MDGVKVEHPMQDKGVTLVIATLFIGIGLLVWAFMSKPEYGGLVLLIAGGLITFAIGMIGPAVRGYGLLVALIAWPCQRFSGGVSSVSFKTNCEI